MPLLLFSKVNCWRKLASQLMIARDEYRKLVENEIKKKKSNIESSINAFSDIEELKQHAITEIDKYENAKNRDYISRIDQFRKYN